MNFCHVILELTSQSQVMENINKVFKGDNKTHIILLCFQPTYIVLDLLEYYTQSVLPIRATILAQQGINSLNECLDKRHSFLAY